MIDLFWSKSERVSGNLWKALKIRINCICYDIILDLAQTYSNSRLLIQSDNDLQNAKSTYISE